MELEYSIWLIGLIALIAGALIGALAYRFFAPSIKQADKVKSELDDAREEFDNYKVGVSQHFDRTGELVNELAQNYVKVYQHLAEGAQTLGAGKSFPELQEQQSRVALDLKDEPEVEVGVADDSARVPEEVVDIQGPADYVVDTVDEAVREDAAPTSSQDEKPAKEVSEPAEEAPGTVEVTEEVEDAEAKERAEKIKNAPDYLQ